MKITKIVEHLINDCQKNIENENDKEYIIANFETIKQLQKVKTKKDLLKIYEKEYILDHFNLKNLNEIEE
jgi:uncharacterized protein with ACT and thioredoxin-like domain